MGSRGSKEIYLRDGAEAKTLHSYCETDGVITIDVFTPLIQGTGETLASLMWSGCDIGVRAPTKKGKTGKVC
jgi:hypothetical protein